MSNTILVCMSCKSEYGQYREDLKKNQCRNCMQYNSKPREKVVNVG